MGDKPVVLLNTQPPEEPAAEPKKEEKPAKKVEIPLVKLGTRLVVTSFHQNIVGQDPDGRGFDYQPRESITVSSANQKRCTSLLAGGLLTEVTGG